MSPPRESSFWPHFFMPEHAPSFDLWNILSHYPLFYPEIFGVCTCGWVSRVMTGRAQLPITRRIETLQASEIMTTFFLGLFSEEKHDFEAKNLHSAEWVNKFISVKKSTKRKNRRRKQTKKRSKGYRWGRELERALWVDAKMPVNNWANTTKMLNSIDGKWDAKRLKVRSDVPIWYWIWLSMRNNLMTQKMVPKQTTRNRERKEVLNYNYCWR